MTARAVGSAVGTSGRLLRSFRVYPGSPGINPPVLLSSLAPRSRSLPPPLPLFPTPRGITSCKSARFTLCFANVSRRARARGRAAARRRSLSSSRRENGRGSARDRKLDDVQIGRACASCRLTDSLSITQPEIRQFHLAPANLSLSFFYIARPFFFHLDRDGRAIATRSRCNRTPCSMGINLRNRDR